MLFLYNLSIAIYHLSIRIASLWIPKAQQWIEGRTTIFEDIRSALQPNEKRVWFHCASLGEFEQGRSLIEAYRKKHPEQKIVLTFFSPSGYEIRKKYAGADYVFYLPLDTAVNATLFLSLIHPHKVYFIKYEFWYHYMSQLAQKEVPIYLVSAIFRPNQLFFRWYGGFYRSLLKKVTHFFVQNEESRSLLKTAGITNVTVSGDTRFDRVLTIAANKKSFPLVEAFKRHKKIIIAGSSWPQEEKILAAYMHQQPTLKYILAPHEIAHHRIVEIEALAEKAGLRTLRYSAAAIENVAQADVLIIDNIGMLSSLYQYGDVAFIGGGFGKGLHNVLEAATFGLPLVVGPRYQQFQEARELIDAGGAICIHNTMELKAQVESLLKDEHLWNRTSEICRQYVLSKQGATEKIMNSTC